MSHLQPTAQPQMKTAMLVLAVMTAKLMSRFVVIDLLQSCSQAADWLSIRDMAVTNC